MSNSDNAQSAIFTSKEQLMLEKTNDIRDKIVDAMTVNGVPDRVGEIRVLNEIMSGIDKSIYDSAESRLKYQDGQNKEALLETVAMIIKDNKRSKQLPRTNTLTDVPDEYIPVDMVYGETEIQPEPLNQDEILSMDAD